MITKVSDSHSMQGQAQQREIVSIEVNRIVAGNNDRHTFDREKLEELAASIAAHGLAQPDRAQAAAARALPQHLESAGLPRVDPVQRSVGLHESAGDLDRRAARGHARQRSRGAKQHLEAGAVGRQARPHGGEALARARHCLRQRSTDPPGVGG